MSRKSFFATATAAAAVLLPACSGGPGPEEPAPLAFVLPDLSSVTYVLTDTGSLAMKTPMGDVDSETAWSTTLEMNFADDPGGVRVTATLSEFAASASLPGMGEVSSDLNAVEGSLEAVIDSRGRAREISSPQLTGPAAELGVFEGLVHQIFPRLPARVAEPGMSWVDTLSWSSDESESKISTTAISSYTVVGDTVVEGRALLKLGVTVETTSETTMSQAGMQLTMEDAGTQEGTVLWDAARGLLFSQELRRQSTGTLSMEGMPMAGAGGMAVENEGVLRIQLLTEEPS